MSCSCGRQPLSAIWCCLREGLGLLVPLPVYSFGQPLPQEQGVVSSSPSSTDSHTLWSLMELGKEAPDLFLRQPGDEVFCFRSSPRSSWSLPVAGKYSPTPSQTQACFTSASLQSPGRNGLTALPQQLEAFGSLRGELRLAAGH